MVIETTRCWSIPPAVLANTQLSDAHTDDTAPDPPTRARPDRVATADAALPSTVTDTDPVVGRFAAIVSDTAGAL